MKKINIVILVLSEDTIPLYIEFKKLQEQTWDSYSIDGVKTYYFFDKSKIKRLSTYFRIFYDINFNILILYPKIYLHYKKFNENYINNI